MTEKTTPQIALPELISPLEASQRVADGAVLVDVRSALRRAENGAIPGAVIADRNNLDETFGLDSSGKHEQIVSKETPIVVICGSVEGSTPVAEALIGQGFVNVTHVDGGFAGWNGAGLPVAAAANPTG
jgi:rhodanese-related sulfurtransferase